MLFLSLEQASDELLGATITARAFSASETAFRIVRGD
jgi:hypothetical protein